MQGWWWVSMFAVWVTLVSPAFCQSGDGDWGSGLDLDSTLMIANDTFHTVGDEPARTTANPKPITHINQPPSPAPTLLYEPQPDKCSVFFSTKTSARLKAYQEEMAYLQAIQHGNRAVMDNLVQYVGAELGQNRYEDIIKENIIGIQAEQKSCHETVEKAEEDLKKQLEGEAMGALSGMQKVREESLAFEDMLSAAADIASRLESSAQTLHAAFTRKLKHMVRTQHVKRLERERERERERWKEREEREKRKREMERKRREMKRWKEREEEKERERKEKDRKRREVEKEGGRKERKKKGKRKGEKREKRRKRKETDEKREMEREKRLEKEER
ncbi:hypothetical protein WMY93_015492 [Mugilogobius chulae]|uniref:Uncharacterized protein n=1 Tax=Mugilogobius chulae TaxID=88201 RepID=A0AAW0NXC7_9GOBI